MAQVKTQAEEKRREDEIRMAQIAADRARDEAKREVDKDFTLNRWKCRPTQVNIDASSNLPPHNRGAMSPKLSAFMDEKDELNIYLLCFERYAMKAQWEEDTWPIRPSALLSERTEPCIGLYTQKDVQ